MRILLLGPTWRNASIAEFLVKREHEVTQYNERFDVAWAHERKIDFIISSGYGPIIGAPMVNAFPRKIINLHATYLPWGKGIGALLFAILEGSPLGVSIHYIDAGIDSGDVIARKKLELGSLGTLRSVYQDLLNTMEQFFIETWPSIEQGKATATSQHSLGPKVPYRSRLDSEIFMDCLPDVWDTSIETLQQWALEFQMNQAFWDNVHGEANER